MRLRADISDRFAWLFESEAGSRVDRSTPGLIIVRGVKISGKRSPNRHGLGDAVNGCEYTPEAFEKARPLYEGLKVNVDHPDCDNPNAERSSKTRLGKLINVRIIDGEPYGDLHMLESASMAKEVANAAEVMPDAFALSHNARGVGTIVNGVYVITEIPEVRSVDVVADGGTCVSLFESQERTAVKKTLATLIRESKHLGAKVRKRLVEATEPGMMDDDLQEMAPEVPVEGAAPEEGDWKQDIINGLGKLVQSDDSEMHDLAAKLLKLLQPDPGASEEETDTEESGDEGDPMDDGDPDDNPGVKESLSRTKKELTALKDDLSVRDLCESMQFVPTPLQRKALLALGNEKDRKAMIAELKPNRSAPRSGAAGSVGRSVQESRQSASPKTAEEQAAALLR